MKRYGINCKFSLASRVRIFSWSCAAVAPGMAPRPTGPTRTDRRDAVTRQSSRCGGARGGPAPTNLRHGDSRGDGAQGKGVRSARREPRRRGAARRPPPPARPDRHRPCYGPAPWPCQEPGPGRRPIPELPAAVQAPAEEPNPPVLEAWRHRPCHGLCRSTRQTQTMLWPGPCLGAGTTLRPKAASCRARS